MSPPSLPEELSAARDAVVDAFYDGREAEDELTLLKDWLEFDGWDCLVDDWDTVVCIDWIKPYLNDKEFAMGWVGEDAKITDQMRIDHVKQMLTTPFEDGDDSIVTVHSYELKSSSGKSAVLGCTMTPEGGGQSVSWDGLYKNFDELRASIKDCGMLTIDKVQELTDEQLLSLWEK